MFSGEMVKFILQRRIDSTYLDWRLGFDHLMQASYPNPLARAQTPRHMVQLAEQEFLYPYSWRFLQISLGYLRGSEACQ